MRLEIYYDPVDNTVKEREPHYFTAEETQIILDAYKADQNWLDMWKEHFQHITQDQMYKYIASLRQTGILSACRRTRKRKSR